MRAATLALLAGCAPCRPAELGLTVDPPYPVVGDTLRCVDAAGEAQTARWTRGGREVGEALEVVADGVAGEVFRCERAGASAQAAVRASSPPRANVLLLVLDDVGVEQVGAYGVGGATRTPRLDALAEEGVRFDRAYANAICSPTRATLLTGRYARRSGVGTGVQVGGREPGLPLAEVTIPEALAASPAGPWSSAMIGKWHLAPELPAALRDPLDQGFQHFVGTVGNLADAFSDMPGSAQSYERWRRVVDGKAAWNTTYATTQTVDDALTAARRLGEPWFIEVAFHAAHAPWHVPPAALRDPTAPTESQSARHALMLRALDTEIGRLLDSLDPAVRTNTLVIAVGDNGTSSEVASAPYDEKHAKGTLFEGGVRVPMVVVGPGVSRGVSRALVQTVDVMPTVLEVAQVPLPLRREGGSPVVLDGISLWPYLADPSQPSLRTWAWVERFSPNGCAPGSCTVEQVALIGDTHKLMWSPKLGDHLFRVDGAVEVSAPEDEAGVLPLMVAERQRVQTWLGVDRTW